MNKKELESIEFDVQKSMRIAVKISEEVIHSIEKSLEKEDNKPRFTAMILQHMSSILTASYISLHREVAQMDNEQIVKMVYMCIKDAFRMSEQGAVKAGYVNEH